MICNLGIDASAKNTLNRDFYSAVVSDRASSSSIDKDVHSHTALYKIRKGFLMLHLQKNFIIYGIQVTVIIRPY